MDNQIWRENYSLNEGLGFYLESEGDIGNKELDINDLQNPVKSEVDVENLGVISNKKTCAELLSCYFVLSIATCLFPDLVTS